ncbi:MAG: pilus assembly protein [Actinobacteria bacterium]|nr:pilus assembly protein [Actinomycetota bacterium]
MRGWRRGDDRGVSALELAIIAPSLLLLIFFVIQAALYFYGRSVALQAAREAVSQLRLQQTVAQCQSSVGSVSTYAKSYAADVGGNFVQAFAVTKVDCGTDQVTVTVTAHSISLIGIDFPITETVSGQVEHFQSPQ